MRALSHRMPIERVAMTGSSGIYGRGVIRALRRRCPGATILGLDIAEPEGDAPDEFARCDIAGGALPGLIAAFRPDTVIHLAFAVHPLHDLHRMSRINLGGARNVIEGARRWRPARLLVSSSATVYGAWPDNPLPMEEDWRPRPNGEYTYAVDKIAVERMFAAFAAEEPQTAVSWTRPSVIYGPGAKNFMTALIVNAKIIGLPDGSNTPIQFIHVDDVAEATVMILESNLGGPFNLAPEDWVTLRDVARLSGRACVPLPLALCRAWSALWWRLRLPWFRFPPAIWSFLSQPWVIAPARLRRELGFRCRHTSFETLEHLLREKGCLRRDRHRERARGSAVAGGGGRFVTGELDAGGGAGDYGVGALPPGRLD